MKKIFLLFLAIGCFACKNGSDKEKETFTAHEPIRDPEVAASISRGAEIYTNFCVTCHLAEGQGIPGVFPPLNNSDWLVEKEKESIRAIKFGLKGPIEVNGESYDNLMPAPGLTDQEIADVMNYILTSWNNNLKPDVTKGEVAAIEK